MSYDLIERSGSESEPYELYKFTQGENSWFFTNARSQISYAADIYEPVSIKRSEITQTQEINKSSLKIQMSIYNPYVEQFKSSPSPVVNSLKIYRGHSGDSDVFVIWFGRHINTKFSESLAELELESIFTSLRRPCLRFRYQRNCPHDLYGVGCKVVKADYVEFENVTTVNGTDINIYGLGSNGDGYYSGGFANLNNDGVIQSRFILTHVGDDIVLDLPFVGLLAGMELSLYPGCDRTTETCNSKFSNILNFGGQPYYPEKNPFTGEEIF
jgi:uncharacterized phage protein (TIGR02218 family)